MVLVTGGSQGMGKSVARQLAGKGAHVIIVARNVERLKEAVTYIAVRATIFIPPSFALTKA